jgi:hypothetical protein
MSRMHKYVRDWNQVGGDIAFAIPIIIVLVFIMENC